MLVPRLLLTKSQLVKHCKLRVLSNSYLSEPMLSILPGVRAKGKTKGVIPGGITPIRRSRTTLLPAEGPPLPFRPRLPSRTDQSWAGLGIPRIQPYRSASPLRLIQTTQRIDPSIRITTIPFLLAHSIGAHPSTESYSIFGHLSRADQNVSILDRKSPNFQPDLIVSTAFPSG